MSDHLIAEPNRHAAGLPKVDAIHENASLRNDEDRFAALQKRAQAAEAEVCKLAAELSKTTDALFKLIERNKKLRDFIINAIITPETSGTPSEGKSNG